MRTKSFTGLKWKMCVELIPVLMLLLFGVVWGGCGGKKSQHAASKDMYNTGTQVELTGLISVRGSTPATMVILETDDDEICTIQSSELTDELAVLAGVRVRVTGIVRSPGGDGPILLTPSDYHILTLETGETPVIGWVAKMDEDLFLTDKESVEWRITGDLVSILSGFEGSKLWVVGKKREMDASSREIRVTGYGILAKK